MRSSFEISEISFIEKCRKNVLIESEYTFIVFGLGSSIYNLFFSNYSEMWVPKHSLRGVFYDFKSNCIKQI